MNEELEDLKDKMPTERKSVWRTPEERRMSDLTRVLEWLERRKGKKKLEKSEGRGKAFTKESEKVVPKLKSPAKPQTATHRVMFTTQALKHTPAPSESTASSPLSVLAAHQPGETSTEGKPFLATPSSSVKPDHSATPRKKKQSLQSKVLVKGPKKEEEYVVPTSKSFLLEGKRRRQSSISASSTKEAYRKSELDIKDVIALETNQRPFRQQSTVEPMLQDIFFSQRRSTLFREWAGKTSEALYERRLKSLIEKTPEPKVEASKMLRPEEVLSCRYLRLSKNNVRTLLKLCKDAGMNVDIHPHMVEGEIDGCKVFGHNVSITL